MSRDNFLDTDDEPAPDQFADGIAANGDPWSVARYGSLIVHWDGPVNDDIPCPSVDDAIAEFHDICLGYQIEHDELAASTHNRKIRVVLVVEDMAPGLTGPAYAAIRDSVRELVLTTVRELPALKHAGATVTLGRNR